MRIPSKALPNIARSEDLVRVRVRIRVRVRVMVRLRVTVRAGARFRVPVSLPRTRVVGAERASEGKQRVDIGHAWLG